VEVDLPQLRALVAAIDEGSFEAAARVLHVTPSAVSQRIKALETAAGQVLLLRSKPITVTGPGQSYLRLARQIQALTAEAVAGDGDAGEPPVVALAVNGDSLGTWVLPALAPLAHAVRFDIRREDQDHSAALLRQGVVMAAITTAAQPVQGCTVTRLGTMRYRPMASPAFVRRWFPDGATPDALAAAPVLTFDRRDDLQDAYLRRRTRRRLDPPRHYIPATADFGTAVRLGMGWGMLPDQQLRPERRRRQLVEFDPGAHLDVVLNWQQWTLRTDALDRTAAAIRAAAAEQLDQPRRSR
jgi:LysR family transcriptional regulator (chromosome initiation inhibitor)